MWEFKQTPENGVLATDNNLFDGIGDIRKLVDVETYLGERDLFGERAFDHTHEGQRCRRCGCDRAVFETHTEIWFWSLRCQNCNGLLANNDD